MAAGASAGDVDCGADPNPEPNWRRLVIAGVGALASCDALSAAGLGTISLPALVTSKRLGLTTTAGGSAAIAAADEAATSVRPLPSSVILKEGCCFSSPESYAAAAPLARTTIFVRFGAGSSSAGAPCSSSPEAAVDFFCTMMTELRAGSCRFALAGRSWPLPLPLPRGPPRLS